MTVWERTISQTKPKSTSQKVTYQCEEHLLKKVKDKQKTGRREQQPI